MNDWISVETKLPEIGERVIGFTKWGNIEICERFTHDYDDYEPVAELYRKVPKSTVLWSDNEPTHWMPLPEPPKS